MYVVLYRDYHTQKAGGEHQGAFNLRKWRRKQRKERVEFKKGKKECVFLGMTERKIGPTLMI